MASPLSFFRKHQYAALVAVGVLAIVSFVIIPPIDDYLRSRSSGGGPQAQAVVVTWSEGRIRESDLRSMQVSHHLTMNFLDAMAEETRRRNGQPKAMRLFRNDSEQALIATMLLAEKASQLGFVISDAAIHVYLDRLADGLFDHRDLNELLRSSTGGRLTRISLFKQLRRELLAHYMRQMAFTGVAASTPASDFQHFNQLRERLKLELLPLPVSDFVEAVDRQPTETDLRELFEQHREDFANPFRPEPGFRRLPKIDFAFLKADFNVFLEQEKQKITEEAIQAEYEAGKLGGEFRRSSRPGQSTFETPGFPGFPTDPAEGLPAEPVPSEPVPEATPASETPEGSDPVSPDSEPPQPVAPEPLEDASPETESPETESPPSAPAPSDPEATSESDAAEEPTADENPDCAPFPQEEEEEVPEPESPTEPEATEPELAPKAPALQESDEEQPVDEEEEPRGDEAAATETDEPESAVEPAEQPEPAAEPPVSEFLTLEEVRDQIVQKLASPLAQERLESALNEARAELDAYFQAFTIWNQQPANLRGSDRPRPTPPDLPALAQRLHFTYGQTGLVDIFEVSDTELGDTARFDAMTRSIRSFAQIAFDEDVPLFRVREIGSNTESGVDFLYWKVATQDEFTPEFEDIRVEVEEAWRKLEARKLTEARAAELQKMAAERPGSLRAALPDYADRVFETNEFTWLTPGNIGFNPFAQPTLGSVEGVEGVSWQFMESVFDLKEGEVGIARNGPEDTFFVARAVRRSPADERQRQQFLQAFRMGGIQDILPLQQDDQRAYYQQWYQDLEAEMQVSWKRPADQLAP